MSTRDHRELEVKARDIVADYTLQIQERAGKFMGSTKELPGVVGFGDSYESCREATIKAQIDAVFTLLRQGFPVPEGGRTEQLNLRLSGRDKQRLQAAISKNGTRSVSEFVRDAAMKAAAQLGV